MIRRSQTPPLYRDYRRYKPFLRIDFQFRCAYCQITEYRWGSDRNFVVEHFRPVSKFKSLECVYSNLYYACNRCNDHKSDKWPTKALVRRGYYWADPCTCDIYGDHLEEQPDGSLRHLTNAGEYTEKHLQLNGRPYLVTWRRERTELRKEVQETRQLIQRIERELMPRLSKSDKAQLSKLLTEHRDLCARIEREY